MSAKSQVFDALRNQALQFGDHLRVAMLSEGDSIGSWERLLDCLHVMKEIIESHMAQEVK